MKNSSDNMIRVLVADDHALVRDGICSLLELESDMEVVAIAEDGESAVRQVSDVLPDVVVMDIRMPGLNGIEATRQIKSQNDDVAVLGMSVHHEKLIVDDILAAGASGYLLKGDAGTELASAIRTVSSGEVYLCPTTLEGQ